MQDNIPKGNCIRRRFYLSPESLAYLDRLALLHQTTSSLLLDKILLELTKKTAPHK